MSIVYTRPEMDETEHINKLIIDFRINVSLDNLSFFMILPFKNMPSHEKASFV